MTVGEVEEFKAVVPPLEYSQPWPKELAPVPPLSTVRVPVMVERVVVAIQVGIPPDKART